jgi:hypothetical protein
MNIAKVVKIVGSKDQSSDFEYWQGQSYQSRLSTLEQIRLEYHQWKYHAEPRLQRVFTIIKRK